MKKAAVHQKSYVRSALANQPGQAYLRHQPIAGFTLTELMVVISIIVILMAAVALTSLKMFSYGAEQHTRIILAAAKSIADEYEIHTGGPINHHSGPTSPFDWGSTAPDRSRNDDNDPTKVCNDPKLQGHKDVIGASSGIKKFQHASSERFVWAAYQLPATRAMLLTLGEEVLTDENRNCFLELRDGWGKKIVYVAYQDDSPADISTETINVDNFLPEYPRPFFASAGPDGEWDTDDDLYSFDID